MSYDQPQDPNFPNRPPYDSSMGQPPQFGAPPPPPGYGTSPTPFPSSKPDNYLIWAILSTLFCCLPFGIASIVFAAQVDSKWAQGDYTGAQDSSAKAKKFAMVGAILGVVGAALYILAIIIVAATSTTVPSTRY